MDLKHYAQARIAWLDNLNIKKQRRHQKIDQYLNFWAKVLDIWCWNGSFFELWKHKEINYFWIDYNKDIVKNCQSRWLDVQQSDISKQDLPYKDNEFDFVYCSHVLEHLLSNEQISLFSQVSRVLKKNWIFMLFTPTPYSWYFWDDPTHQRPSTHWSLIELSNNFDLQVIESKYSNTRMFSNDMQKWLRLPPMRFFLWEVYLIAQKN